MMERTVLRSLLIAAVVISSSAACAAGRDEVIPNPNPDRSWGRTVRGVFTSGRSIAVVIAISNYIGERTGGYQPLPTAKHDADKMIDFLIKDAGFDTVYVLTDERATKSRIDQLMTDVIPGTITSLDRFLFYWSGHGDQRLSADGKRAFGFLPLADSKAKEFSNMVSMKDLERWDGYLDARHVLFVLDACLSGLAGVEKKSPGDARSEQLSLPAHHLLTAGTASEIVISGDKWGGSLFTDSFILGAKGQARSSSGIVSLFSLIDFIQDRVVIEKRAANWSRSLTPQLQSLQAGDGAFYFNPPRTGELTSNAPRTRPPVERKGDIEQTMPQMNEAERAWNLTKDTKSVAVLESFIARYNNTFYAELARERIGQLKPHAVLVAPPSPAKPTIQTPSVRPITIGFSMALTGGLAANGKSALLAQKIWEEDVNAKGGLLGRPVKLVYYDDKSSPGEVPGLYTRLLEIDKVDLLIGPYGTPLIAPAMPIVIHSKKTLVALFGLGVNNEFNYPKYFAMNPTGPDPKSFTEGFFEVAAQQTPKPRTVALIAADVQFTRNQCEGASVNARNAGLTIVYDKKYPPSMTDFASTVREIRATNADVVTICSFPLDSVGMVRAVNQLNYKPKMIGGAMVGLQATAIKTQLGPLLNGWTNFDLWLPVPKLEFPGVADLMKRYQARAAAEGVDPLGYYMVPWGYAQLQVLQQAVEGTKSLDDAILGNYIRANTFKTVVGDVEFGLNGEWAKPRVLQVQFQNLKGYDVHQFKDISTQVVVAPAEYKSGKMIYPYEMAK
jgi:branched-chain amino acid transport system substrate-binding protein